MAEYSSSDKQAVLAGLMKVHHGDLMQYIQPMLPTAKGDPEYFAHLAAWNTQNGKVEDAKKALPPIALRGLTRDDPQFAENAVALMLMLDPRDLVASYRFSTQLTKMGHHIPGNGKLLMKGLNLYLEAREAHRGWWERAVLSNREAMRTLYAVSHRKLLPFVKEILFEKKYPPGSVFEQVRKLKEMLPIEAAGTILKYRIPWPIAIGAVAKMKDPHILLALIENMSGNEVIKNTKMLQKLGVFEDPALKAAYDKAIERGKEDKRVNAFVATKAAEVIGDQKLARKVISVQRSQEQKVSALEGDWLICGDASQSMEKGIEISKMVASVIASRVKGKVLFSLFNHEPRFFDVTGKSFDEIRTTTKYVRADGGTSHGCSIAYALEHNIIVNGIVFISDGGERHTPSFTETYQRYVKKFDIQPSVYLFLVPGADPDWLTGRCQQADIRIETRNLGDKVDLYSLPNVLMTLRPGLYGLLDEIMETPLMTFAKVTERRM